MDDDSFATNTFQGRGSGKKSYALTGKIMLSAIIVLFAVVVIMVFLHIYARWYLINARRRQHRRGRRRTHFVFYVEPNNPASIAASYPPRGLDANVLKSLPTFTYSAAKTDDDDREVLECAVCLCEFEENEKGRLLPKCNHSFHLGCIDMWFHSHSTCPLCRSSVDADSCIPEEGSAHHQNVSTAAEEDRDRVVVDIGELTQTQRVSNQGYDMCQRSDGSQFGTVAGRPAGPSTGFASSSSFAGGRMKGADFVGVEIEVPRRCISFSNTTNNNNPDGSRLSSPGGGGGQPLKSPTSRLLSLRRILSREKKSPLPSPSSVVGTSCWSSGGSDDSEVEMGRSETQPLSPAQTPR